MCYLLGGDIGAEIDLLSKQGSLSAGPNAKFSDKQIMFALVECGTRLLLFLTCSNFADSYHTESGKNTD